MESFGHYVYTMCECFIHAQTDFVACRSVVAAQSQQIGGAQLSTQSPCTL